MTRARTLGTGAAVLYLLALLAVAAAFGLLRDRLFFRADPWSIALTVGFLAALAWAIPAIGWAATCGVAPTLARRIERWLLGLASFGILCGLGLAIVSGAALGLRIEPLLNVLRSGAGFAAVVAVVVVFAAFPAFVARGRDGFAQRTRRLAVALALGAVVIVPGGALANRLLAGPAAQSPRLVAMIVLDGLPARYTHSLDSRAPRTRLDEVLARGRLYTNLRSSTVWTFGWFGTLWGGSPEAVFEPLRRVHRPDNLIARLQREGVDVRWMVFHQNGAPEASAGHVDAYRGLRSSFLTPAYAWIPRVLGLDYHLVLPGPSTESLLVGEIAKRAFRLLNPRSDADPYLDRLLPELRAMARSGRDAFLLFHVAWNEGIEVDGAPAEPEPPLWAHDADGAPELDRYRYEPGREAEIAARRAGLRPRFEGLGRSLGRFLDALRAEGLAARTTVLLTCDHGSAYEQGRLHYGYHPLEAVVRTPLAVFGDGWSGRDDRVWSTVDLSRSLAELFTADSPRAWPSASPGRAASVTLRSDHHREWFMVLHDGSRKLVANLHSDSEGAIRAYDAPGVDDTAPRELDGAERAAARALVRERLPHFGLEPHEVHGSFSE